MIDTNENEHTAESGLPGMTCSPSFPDTPETALLHAQRENVHSAYFLMRTHAERLERERDAAIKLIDDLDEIMHTMNPRYCGHPTMDGRYPCWIVWLPKEGTCERKTLKEAIIEFAAQTLILPENKEL